jgi:hypothetical protein
VLTRNARGRPRFPLFRKKGNPDPGGPGFIAGWGEGYGAWGTPNRHLILNAVTAIRFLPPALRPCAPGRAIGMSAFTGRVCFAAVRSVFSDKKKLFIAALCQIAWNCDPTFASNSDPL